MKKNNAMWVRSALLTAAVILIAGSMVLMLTRKESTELRSRATGQGPYPSDEQCEANFQAGGGPVAGCEDYYWSRQDKCEAAFRSDLPVEGCSDYVEEREDNCRALGVNDIPGEGCNEYLEREPITLPEQVCNTFPGLSFCD